MPLELNDSVIGEGPDVLLLHGLFGMGSNLGALARSLQDRYRVHSVDLPDHGRSDWLAEASIPAYANAVAEWIDRRGLEELSLVGHSLGGKVAMQLALTDPGRIRKLAVADIAPVKYPGSHDAVFAALSAVASAECGSRSEASALMSEHLEEQMVIQFLLMSLKREPDGVYRWRFNREGLLRGYDALREPPDKAAGFDGPTLFVAGELSPYITADQEPAIHDYFSNARIERMGGVGHWLHAEKPEAFNALVGGFLDA